MQLNDLAKLCQYCMSRNPVIILGSGSSMPHGIRGMDALTDSLRADVEVSPNENAAWQSVMHRLAEVANLEAALEANPLPKSLIEKIVRTTWNVINFDDVQLMDMAVDYKYKFPLSDLFERLLHTTHSTINVVTTNYDRVAEYATDKAGFIHSTGFTPGYIRREEGSAELRVFRGNRPAKMVRIWKVHGSIDWFIDPYSTVLSAPFLGRLPADLAPLIVTPGVSKYQRTHDEPFRSAIQGADRVLQGAGAFLCVGYGFRDSHIHPKLVRRCRVEKMPILIIARTLTEEAKIFLHSNVGPHYVALEKSGDDTRVFSHLAPGGCLIPDSAYWQLQNLNELCGF